MSGGGVPAPASPDRATRTTRESYDAVAAAFLANTRDRSHSADLLDRFAARVRADGLVLDLGAGPGCDTAELRARGLACVGMDLSLGMLRAARDELPGPRVQADLRALPFADASAAGVWANACLLHLPRGDFGRALAEIARVCAPGAVVHLSLKRGEGEEYETERYGRPRFFRYWSGDELDAALARAGFRILDACVRPTRSATWLVRLVTPGGASSG